MKSSRVRVAVRVRPLGHQELAQGGAHVVSARHPEIHLGERRFTFDSVFDTSVSQAALFDQVSGPLQSSFLDGYNATVSLVFLLASSIIFRGSFNSLLHNFFLFFSDYGLWSDRIRKNVYYGE